MKASDVLLLSPIEGECPELEAVLNEFQSFRVSYSLHRHSLIKNWQHTRDILEAFEAEGGLLVMCLVDPGGHLQYQGAFHLTDLPVLGLSPLDPMSTVQQALRILALKKSGLREELRRRRVVEAIRVLERDRSEERSWAPRDDLQHENDRGNA